MSFEAIKKSALAEEITTRLLNLIKERQLHPGDKLPPERELATMMQVSRPSLREALRALSIMNVVEIRQGDGTYVSSLDPHLLVEPLDFIFALDDSTFVQLFEARKIVEVGIVALAAERITDAQLAVLAACLEQAEETVDDPAAFLEVDRTLHDTITQAAGNPILARVMASISRLATASRVRTVSLPGARAETVRDHRAIVAALQARDSAAARDSMLKHLDHIEHKLMALLKSEKLAPSPRDGATEP